MMDKKWVGEVCDICHKQFTEQDDVAVCPECGAPYHKACIAEVKTCVHPELHESGKAWEGKKKKTDAVIKEQVRCPRCGNENPSEGRFCSNCGLPLQNPGMNRNASGGILHAASGENLQEPNPYAMPRIALDPYAGMNPEAELFDGVTVKEASTYVKKNPMYFMTRFKLMGNHVLTMNFSAFLFGGLYFLYRKVYASGILLLIAQVLLSIPAFISGLFYAADLMGIKLPISVNLNLVSGADMVCSMLRIALMFVSGFLFNRLYKNHVISHVKRIKEKRKDSPDMMQEISLRGGVNFALIFTLLAAYFAGYYLIVFFLIQKGGL